MHKEKRRADPIGVENRRILDIQIAPFPERSPDPALILPYWNWGASPDSQRMPL
jgi:hypothetical protein